jgi:DNA-directed RNA polymerase subunit RPC12/RpoP
MEINDFIKRGEIIIIDDRYETQRCLYCNKRRIKKEVWEDVK